MRSRHLFMFLSLATCLLVAATTPLSGSLAIYRDTARSQANAFTANWHDLYLHNVPSPPTGDTNAYNGNMPLNFQPPTYTGALPRYSVNCYDEAGRVSSPWVGGGAACQSASWQTAPFTRARSVAGTVTLHIWIMGYTSATARFYDVNGATATQIGPAVTIAAATAWSLQTDSLAMPAATSIGVGHALRLTITPGLLGHSIGYDTTDFRSYVTLP